MTKALVLEAQALLRGRGHYLGTSGPNHDGVDGDPGTMTWTAVLAELRRLPTMAPVAPPLAKPPPLQEQDYVDAAAALHPQATPRLIRAVKTVESGGGWFTDVRADILDRDGPGGFLDGPDLPKILFEAHKFSGHTGHRYDGTHPNISSRSWNRALYVGGPGEYIRLHQAMQLDRAAALMSASVGMFQILGENYRAAGYASVELYWEAMKVSERAHLLAFVSFVKANGLVDELLLIPQGNGGPFAGKYNGPGQVAVYGAKLVDAYRHGS